MVSIRIILTGGYALLEERKGQTILLQISDEGQFFSLAFATIPPSAAS